MLFSYFIIIGDIKIPYPYFDWILHNPDGYDFNWIYPISDFRYILPVLLINKKDKHSHNLFSPYNKPTFLYL